MKAKSSLSLPMPKALTSNKLEDIQEHFRKINEALDKQYRLLWQDAATIQIDVDGWIYFGNKDTDGSWRIGEVSNNCEIQKRILSTWTTMGKWSE